jgi:hypothetical protein
MKNQNKFITGGTFLLLIALCLFPITRETTLDADVVAQIYELPRNSLSISEITEQEKWVLEEEKKDALKEDFPMSDDVEVIAAWQIEPKIPSTFYHVRIAITTLRDFSNDATKYWKRLEISKAKKNAEDERFAKLVSRYKNLPKSIQENDGNQSGMHMSRTDAMSNVKEDGSHSKTSFSNFIALVFESNNKGKKYSIRITQGMDLIDLKKGGNELLLIKGGEKYHEKWKWHIDKGLMWEMELLENVDFNYIFAELKNLTTNYIEETNIVERFYAEREAKRKKAVTKTIIKTASP